MGYLFVFVVVPLLLVLSCMTDKEGEAVWNRVWWRVTGKLWRRDAKDLT